MRLMAARGLAPLPPADLATALYQLSFAEDEAVKSAAFKTAAELPERILGGALEQPLDARVLDFFARRVFSKRRCSRSCCSTRRPPTRPSATWPTLVGESGLEMIAKNEERLLRHPPIIAALYMNPKTRMSTAQRALELAVRNNVRVEGIPAFDEAARAIQQSGAPDPAQLAKEDAAFARAAEVAVDQTAALQLIAVDEKEAAALAEAEAQAAERRSSRPTSSKRRRSRRSPSCRRRARFASPRSATPSRARCSSATPTGRCRWRPSARRR